MVSTFPSREKRGLQQTVLLLLLAFLSTGSGQHLDLPRHNGRQLQSAQGLQLPVLSLPSVVLKQLQLAGQPAEVVAQQADGLAVQQQGGMESRAVSSGFAVNGGKARAKAVAHVQQPASGGLVSALAHATAAANHASQALAVSKSGASNMAKQGVTVADTTAEALADHGSTAAADSGSRAMGLGGVATSAGTTTRSAATDGSRSIVVGTAVSSAVGHDSTAHVISDSTGAAEHQGFTRTAADSITIGVDGSAATGTAKSTASSQQHGAAVSHSLMESFSLFNGSRTDANSLATAHGSKGGAAASRDKAVGIGLWSSQAATNTSTEVVSTKLGLAVVTSVVRSITAQGRLACADAIRRAAAELATGPQLNINDVTLHLGDKVPQKCLTSYKDLAVTALRKAKAEQQAADPVTEAGAQVQDFERVKGGVQAGMAPALQAAQEKLHGWLDALAKKQQPTAG